MPVKVEIPFGQLENQRLEFKSAAALKSPEKIAREVVAMLNADGGEIWVGLREEDGRAVEIEAIADAEAAKSRLMDFLVDTLEPSPSSQEVSVEVVPLSGDGNGDESLLRVLVTNASERKPYAMVRGTAWSFPRRIGARLVPMTREEIGQAMRGSATPGEKVAAARKEFLDWREDWRRGRSGLWVGLKPIPALSLDVQEPLFKEVAFSPVVTGNRSVGWNFANSDHRPEVAKHSTRWGAIDKESQYEVIAEVFDDGKAAFFVSFGGLAWKGEDLWPFTILEYPISAFRIMSYVARTLTQQGFQLLADLALFDVAGRVLRPGSPGDFQFRARRPSEFAEGPDLMFQNPLVFDRQELINEPDRCGYRLVKRLYQAFGLQETEIPKEYDRNAGRLVLPE